MAIATSMGLAQAQDSGSLTVRRWLSRAVAGAHQAVLSTDAATRRVTGRHG